MSYLSRSYLVNSVVFLQLRAILDFTPHGARALLRAHKLKTNQPTNHTFVSGLISVDAPGVVTHTHRMLSLLLATLKNVAVLILGLRVRF